jgi:phosphoribosylformylglycinamidine synthase
MKFGVVVFPGSNCDRDMIHVLRNVMKSEVVEIWHKEESLPDFDFNDCVVLPGGFSYGDYLRSGALARFSPIMKAVIEFAGRGGKVMGICNGFQILCEAGLLPGTLQLNNNQKFVCKNVYLKADGPDSALSATLPAGKVLQIPIAHAEGRFLASEEVLDEIEANKQVLFRYCDENGQVNEDSNPNGSARNIAGVRNKEGNVFGMMPHPERASEHILNNQDGRLIFDSLLQSSQVPA